MTTTIAGNEITGIGDPATAFIVVGVILGIGFFAFVIWTLYQMVS